MTSTSERSVRSDKGRSRGTLIVSGILFWYPLSGVTFQFLHYLLGLRRLGWDVYYVEDSGRWVYDPVRRELTPDPRANIARVEPVLRAYGLGECWAFRGAYPGGACYGMSEAQLAQLYREADVLLNVTGAQELRDEHMCIARRVYIETDPFGSQVRLAQGDAALRAVIDAHDTWFSFGENIGHPQCLAPTDRSWLPTRQPVVLELWANATNLAQSNDSGAYRTLATWHNDGKDVVYQGEVYHWTKDREFLRFVEVASLRPALRFELATDAHEAARGQLRRSGFGVLDALAISSECERYRGYIRNSRAELSVARDQYVRPHTGWFSDRSACYLASGRPVIMQDTGFSRVLPVGRGLFRFENLGDLTEAVDAIEADYVSQRAAAIEIAREYFAADRVLTSLLSRVGL